MGRVEKEKEREIVNPSNPTARFVPRDFFFFFFFKKKKEKKKPHYRSSWKSSKKDLEEEEEEGDITGEGSSMYVRKDRIASISRLSKTSGEAWKESSALGSAFTLDGDQVPLVSSRLWTTSIPPSLFGFLRIKGESVGSLDEFLVNRLSGFSFFLSIVRRIVLFYQSWCKEIFWYEYMLCVHKLKHSSLFYN